MLLRTATFGFPNWGERGKAIQTFSIAIKTYKSRYILDPRAVHMPTLHKGLIQGFLCHDYARLCPFVPVLGEKQTIYGGQQWAKILLCPVPVRSSYEGAVDCKGFFLGGGGRALQERDWRVVGDPQWKAEVLLYQNGPIFLIPFLFICQTL